ncbi:Prosolanapyrone synthase [Frankliniella fusca]|uniref:Prosolanapyrone synthase n=1 Tax=Frankliniella fusca TaxID=407009 RepID=A0AAE1LNE1_9NEOP|nr:Prosolanapyrone synthase [Frankliniella fusca]
MPSPGAAQVLILVALTQLASTQTTSGPTLSLPCCFASAQNATSLGPVVVLRRDDEQPAALHGGGGGTAPGAAAAVVAAGALPADPTWEATLRRAATRALTWEGLNDAPFVSSHHSAEVLAALDEPGDIRVLARGLLVADRDGHPVFREVDLPGEQCVDCPADLPGPNGESIKAMWSVRRIRHSGPNADHRPCYELQFSVTPIVPALPPLSRWEPPGPEGAGAGAARAQGLRAGLRAESRVSRQRELRPKGLILRVNAVPDTAPLQQLAANALAAQQGVPLAAPAAPAPAAAVGASPGSSLALQQLAASALAANGLATQRTDSRGAAQALVTPAVAVLASDPRPTVPGRVHEHLHHHFYMRGGVPVYAGSTTETEFPATAAPGTTPAFRPSPQYHEYSQPDPLFHPPPGFGTHAGHVGHSAHSVHAAGHATAHATGHAAGHAAGHATGQAAGHAGHVHYPNSINEQLPPIRDGADTRVPYVSASKQNTVTPAGSPLPPTPAAVPVSTSAASRPTTPRPSQRPSTTTMRFPVDAAGGPTVTILPSTSSSTLSRPANTPTTQTQVYRITGGYSFTTPNSVDATRPSKASKNPYKSQKGSKASSHKIKVPPQNYYEMGRPTKGYAATELEDLTEATELADLNPTMITSGSSSSERLKASATTARPAVTSTEYLSDYPAATIRGTTSTTGASSSPASPGRPTPPSRIPLFTPNYGKDFEMSILKVMTSKVPSYIDIFTENGVRVTTDRPDVEDTTMQSQTSHYSNKYGKHTKALITSTRLFKENPSRGPYSLVSNTSEVKSLQHHKLSTTLHTTLPQPHGGEPGPTTPHRHALTEASASTPSAPLQITFFVASEDDAVQPSASASTLVSDPLRQDDTTTYQYTILRSVEQSINVMKHENDTDQDEIRTSTEPSSSTRRIFTSRDEPTVNAYIASTNKITDEKFTRAPDSLTQPLVNGHTNHINTKTKHVTESYSQLLKNLSLSSEPPTTRKPWRPSTRARRPWRQSSSYKDYYLQKRGQNYTTTASSVDPTSIVESRKTYSVSASRRRRPTQVQHGKPFSKNQKFNKRREQSNPQISRAEDLQSSPSSYGLGSNRNTNQFRRYQASSDHSSLL